MRWPGRGTPLRVEDSIQWALLRSGAAEADFTGKLTVINLTRELPLPGPVREYRGELYASPAVFEGFFNEVTAGPGGAGHLPGGVRAVRRLIKTPKFIPKDCRSFFHTRRKSPGEICYNKKDYQRKRGEQRCSSE